MDASIRANFYALLAQAFSPPDKGWAALNTRAAHSIFKKIKKLYPVSTFSAAVESFEKELVHALQEVDPGELALEYSRLFAGPYKVAVAPYESLYRGDEGQVMAPCAVEVQKLYRENGLEISPEFKDLPDHISAELYFMAYLSIKEAEAGSRRDKAGVRQFIKKQHAFIGEHLALWIDDFSRRLAVESKMAIFVSLGKLVSLFVKLDRDIVSLYLSEM